jgi:hypothetical protein
MGNKEGNMADEEIDWEEYDREVGEDKALIQRSR